MAVAQHGPSAVQEALSLPEIFAMILEAEECSGEDNCLVPILNIHDLKNAMRVNRLWFEIAAEKIWADWGSIDWLFQVPPNRRQIYASKMAQVSITGLKPAIYHRQYKGLVFRKLRNISLEVYGKYELRHLEPYLVPSLQSFSFSYVPKFDSEALSCLQRKTPNLREISISTARFNATLESFCRFIRHAPHLKSVTVSLFGSKTIAATTELLSCLAQSRRLEILRLPWCWTEHVSQQVAAETLHSDLLPFPQITEITLIASSKAVSKLVPLVVNIRQLVLIVKDSTVDVLAPVSRLQHLEDLTIYYLQFNIIDVEALIKLGALSRLSRLHLGPFPHETRITLVQSEFSDHDCEALARRLPHLHHLRLRVQCNISTKAVEAFLRHCPNLRKCEVFQPLNTDNLFTAAPGILVFPQLATLNLKRLAGEEIMRSV